jgi:hypothetical protein
MGILACGATIPKLDNAKNRGANLGEKSTEANSLEAACRRQPL